MTTSCINSKSLKHGRNMEWKCTLGQTSGTGTDGKWVSSWLSRGYAVTSFNPLTMEYFQNWGGLYSLWNAWKRFRRTASGCINDIESSWISILQRVYQNTIIGCRKLIQTCHDNCGTIRMEHFLFKGFSKIWKNKNPNRYLNFGQKFLTSVNCPKYRVRYPNLMIHRISKMSRILLFNALSFIIIRHVKKNLSQFFLKGSL